MKIVCDSCSTKYSISDDKVRGKVFKIRCKKCSHIIVVKGISEAAVAPEAPPDAVWHLVVDGDQVGPLADADVRARLARNEISVENYVWKEGFSDWLRLADVPEFADVASSLPASSELFSEGGADAGNQGGNQSGNNEPTEIAHPAHQPTADFGAFFGAGAAGQEAARAASAGSSGRTRVPAAAAPSEEDAFSVPVAAAPAIDGADLFGAVAPVAARPESVRARGRGSNGTAPAGRHDGGRVESLTAQRSENSVLFSLSNLQSLAAPPASRSSSNSIATTEGSGLIDIRAMAASTLRAPASSGSPLFGNQAQSAQDDLPAFGAFPSAAPVLLGIPSSSGPPKWVYALIGMAAVMILAVLAAAFSILGKPAVVEPPAPLSVPQVAAPAVRGVGTAPDEKSPAVVASKSVSEGDLPPRETGALAAAGGADKTASDKVGVKVLKKGKGKKFAVGETRSAAGTASAAAAAAAAAEPEKAKPAKGSLDDLLEGALNGRKGRPKVEDDMPGKKSAEAPSGGGPLAKGAVVAGMNGVKGKISACYALYKVPGLAMVNVAIAKSGKVSSATVTGKFAGTPTGNCVESAVKTAAFPPSEGLNTPYPFTLR
jgi:predicted Zn finger-like uncharacterized protein